MTTRERPRGEAPPAGPVRLWIGLLGAAFAWLVHILARYPLVRVACREGTAAPLHLVTLACASAAVGTGVLAFTNARSGRREQRAGGGGRRWSDPAFMGRAGVVLSGLFLLVILAEMFPALVQDPCAGVDGPAAARPALLLLAPLLWPRSAAAAPGAPAGAGAGAGPWSSDELFVALALAALALLHARGARAVWRRAGAGRGVSRRSAALFAAGLAALALALLPPLGPLAGALFSAHMAQHLVLTTVAPALLVLARPRAALAWGLPPSLTVRIARVARRAARLPGVRRALTHPLCAGALHVLAVWIWHTPVLYGAALESTAVHALEHATLLGTAVLSWRVLARAGAGLDHGRGALYAFVLSLQCGALGGLLTSSRTFYRPFEPSGLAAWGLSPMEDQQLAGLIMWIPGGAAYVVAALVLFARWVRAAERAAWAGLGATGAARGHRRAVRWSI
ncbi:cytochrome c oxidase assembly protein [Sorangium sp. So ce854]|uniref:cytochrome c oxidase assembly protein n=1 Tax=Sorangium sp. So ce854 TaxID=3133322 RepID=UPI003F62E45A